MPSQRPQDFWHPSAMWDWKYRVKVKIWKVTIFDSLILFIQLFRSRARKIERTLKVKGHKRLNTLIDQEMSCRFWLDGFMAEVSQKRAPLQRIAYHFLMKPFSILYFNIPDSRLFGPILDSWRSCHCKASLWSRDGLWGQSSAHIWSLLRSYQFRTSWHHAAYGWSPSLPISRPS